MNLSSIGSASSVTSGFLSEPPLSPGAAPVPSAPPVPQLRTVDPSPASEALSGSGSKAPAPSVAPLAPLASEPVGASPTPLRGPEPQAPAAPAPAGPAESPSLESTLLRMRLVTPDQIASAMREEAETGRPIAEIVVANGWVTAEDLASIQGGTPAHVAPVAPAPPAPEPLAAAPAPATVEPPAPAPVAPAALEPVASPPVPAAEPAPVSTPEPAPAPEPAPIAAEAPAEQAPAEQVPARPDVTTRVLIRLENGERIEVGNFDGFEAAKTRAAALMDGLRKSSEWPFLSGRYVRPEAIVSIDIELTGF